MCNVLILFQNRPLRYMNRIFFMNSTEKRWLEGDLTSHVKLDENSPAIPVDLIAQQVERRTGISKVRVQLAHESTLFSWLRQYLIIMKKNSVHVSLRMILRLNGNNSMFERVLCWRFVANMQHYQSAILFSWMTFVILDLLTLVNNYK